jgi:hypothetical protein
MTGDMSGRVRGVVELARHVLKAGQVDDDAAADAPQADEHQGGIDPCRVVEPVRPVDPEQEIQRAVDPARLGVEHAAPGEDGRHEGDDVRHEEERLEVARAAERLGVEEQRDRERQDQPDRQCDRREAERDEQCVPGATVVEQVLVVLEPHEAQGLVLDEIDVGEGEREGRQHRYQRQEHEADDPWRDEGVAPLRLAPRDTGSRWRRRRQCRRLDLDDRHGWTLLTGHPGLRNR